MRKLLQNTINKPVKGLLRVTNQIAENCSEINFAIFYKPSHYWINKSFIQTKKTCICIFLQSRCNRVLIELSEVRFWSKSIFVISRHAYDLRPNEIHEKSYSVLLG